METQAWIIAESIDALMDIYAEDETDCLAAEIELVPKLLSIIPHFKSKVIYCFVNTFLRIIHTNVLSV